MEQIKNKSFKKTAAKYKKNNWSNINIYRNNKNKEEIKEIFYYDPLKREWGRKIIKPHVNNQR